MNPLGQRQIWAHKDEKSMIWRATWLPSRHSPVYSHRFIILSLDLRRRNIYCTTSFISLLYFTTAVFRPPDGCSHVFCEMNFPVCRPSSSVRDNEKIFSNGGHNYDVSTVVTLRLNVYLNSMIFCLWKIDSTYMVNAGWETFLLWIGKAGDARGLFGVHFASFQVFGPSVRKHSRRLYSECFKQISFQLWSISFRIRNNSLLHEDSVENIHLICIKCVFTSGNNRTLIYKRAPHENLATDRWDK